MRTLIAACCAFAAVGCQPEPFVTLRIEDPLGVAAAATTLSVQSGEGTNQSRTLDAGFPVTLNLVGPVEGEERPLSVRAIDESGRVLAEQTTPVTFGRSASELVVLELQRRCDSVEACPDDARIWACEDERCVIDRCGDGIVNGEEECDDGDDNSDVERTSGGAIIAMRPLLPSRAHRSTAQPRA